MLTYLLALQVQVNAENLIIHQQFSATVTGGNVAMGPNSRVGDAPDPTAV